MSLRPYQVEDLGSMVAAYERGCTRQVGVQATGSGKTVLVSHIPEALDLAPWQKMLLLVHRDTLVWQSKEKLEKYNPHLVVDVEKAQYRADERADIIVASVQTIGRNRVDENGNWIWCDRISKFDPDDFAIIVVDEGHHALASTYGSVLRYFRCYKPEPQFDDRSKLLLLVTATPKRSDGVGLEVLADEITFRRDIRQQIQDGWLADIKAYRIDTEVDISKVKVEAGEFETKDLEQKVNTKERNQLVVRKYQELGEGQRGVAFTVDVQHSVDLAQEFRDAGITAFALAGKRIPEEQKLIQELFAKHWIVAKTHDEECAGVLKLFDEGVVRVLASCDKLAEGWDSPAAVVAMMTRPLRSSLRYIQNIGRVLRLFPSPEDLAAMRARGEEPAWIKEYGIVLDFVDIAGKHASSLNTVPTLFGMRPDFNMKGKKAVETVEAVEKIIREKAKAVTPSMFTSLDELKGIAQRIDIFAKPEIPAEARQYSQMAWLKSATGGYELPLPDLTLRIDQNTLGQFEVYRAVNGVRTKIGTAAALPEAFKQAEVLVPLDQQILSQADAKWRFEPPTIDQATLLMRLAKKKAPQLIAGAKTPDEFLGILKSAYNKGDVSMLITQYDDRARDGGGLKKPWENRQKWNGGGKPWSARNRKYAAKGRKP